MGGRWICIEFWGNGDPFFGGSGRDLALGTKGAFLEGSYSRADVAHFDSKEEALAAGERAPNRRPGGKLSSWEER